MAKSRGLSLSSRKDFANKRDFGLGEFRLALPENNPRIGIPVQLRQEQYKKTDGKGGIGTKFKQLLRKSSTSSTAKEGSVIYPKPSARAKKSCDPEAPVLNLPRASVQPSPKINPKLSFHKSGGEKKGGLSGTPLLPRASVKPSPVLHSRVLDHIGMKSSLESLLDEYGLKKDGTPKQSRQSLVNSSNLIRLTIASPDEAEHQITLRKNPNGLGIHLSVGPPPVSITLVEPASEAMAAGLKEEDVILEVNGKDCRSIEALEISELMELKSLIQHVPSTSSIISQKKKEKSLKPSGLTITSIDSDIGDSDEGDDEYEEDDDDDDASDSSYNSIVNENEKHKSSKNDDVISDDLDDNDDDLDDDDLDDDIIGAIGNKRKITKGVWNRIKAEGLVDSDSNDSFDMELTRIYNKDILASTEKNTGKSSSSKVEVNEKEWKKLKQQQNLIFNTNAPSSLISQSHKPTNERKTEQTNQANSTTKAIFKWPFKKSSVKKKDPTQVDKKANTTATTQSKEEKRSSFLQPQKSARPKALTLNKQEPKKRDSPPDILVIPRTTTLLGTNVGHERRNIGRTRNVRRPTKRPVNKESHDHFKDVSMNMEIEANSTSQEVDANEISNSGSQTIESDQNNCQVMNKLISDPGQASERTEQQHMMRSYSSAALVEQAVRRRRSMTEQLSEQEQDEPSNVDEDLVHRTRKFTVGSPYSVQMPVGLTAQMVATAAASKARMKRNEATDEGKNLLQKSRKSSVNESGKEQRYNEPSWISVAKHKHEYFASKYQHEAPTTEDIEAPEVMSYTEFVKKSSSSISSAHEIEKNPSSLKLLGSGLVKNKKAIFETKID